MTPQIDKWIEEAEKFLRHSKRLDESRPLLRQAITIIRQQQERADAYFLEVRNLRHDAAETSEALDELQETVDELQDLVGCGCDPPKGHWCDEHHPKL